MGSLEERRQRSTLGSRQSLLRLLSQTMANEGESVSPKEPGLTMGDKYPVAVFSPVVE